MHMHSSLHVTNWAGVGFVAFMTAVVVGALCIAYLVERKGR